MSRIREIGKTIEESLQKDDLEQQDSKTAIHKAVKTTRQQDSKKKCTFYIDGSSIHKFNEIIARRLINGKKADKSVLICEAINLLHREESPYKELK